MMDVQVFVGDIGTVLEITILTTNNTPQDLSGIDDVWLIFTKPDNSTIIKKKSDGVVDILDGGSSGKISYIVQKGIWDIPGYWYVRPRVIIETDITEFLGSSIEILVKEQS